MKTSGGSLWTTAYATWSALGSMLMLCPRRRVRGARRLVPDHLPHTDEGAPGLRDPASRAHPQRALRELASVPQNRHFLEGGDPWSARAAWAAGLPTRVSAQPPSRGPSIPCRCDAAPPERS